jgi:hypothetical protein
MGENCLKHPVLPVECHFHHAAKPHRELTRTLLRYQKIRQHLENNVKDVVIFLKNLRRHRKCDNMTRAKVNQESSDEGLLNDVQSARRKSSRIFKRASTAESSTDNEAYVANTDTLRSDHTSVESSGTDDDSRLRNNTRGCSYGKTAKTT